MDYTIISNINFNNDLILYQIRPGTTLLQICAKMYNLNLPVYYTDWNAVLNTDTYAEGLMFRGLDRHYIHMISFGSYVRARKIILAENETSIIADSGWKDIITF